MKAPETTGETEVIIGESEDTSIGIIGGADGPTAIFITGSLGGIVSTVLLIAGCICGIIAIVKVVKKGKE